MAARGLVVALVGVTAAAAVGWIMFAPTEIDESDVEAGTLAKVSAAPTDDLDCDGGLKAEVGAAQHCTLTRGGEKYSVRLRVTVVDGDNVQWDSVVAGDPQSGRRVPVDELERHTLQILAKDRRVDSVRCDGPLSGTVGAVQRCTMADGRRTRPVEARVTSLDADSVQWSVTVLR